MPTACHCWLVRRPDRHVESYTRPLAIVDFVFQERGDDRTFSRRAPVAAVQAWVSTYRMRDFCRRSRYGLHDGGGHTAITRNLLSVHFVLRVERIETKQRTLRPSLDNGFRS